MRVTYNNNCNYNGYYNYNRCYMYCATSISITTNVMCYTTSIHKITDVLCQNLNLAHSLFSHSSPCRKNEKLFTIVFSM